MTKKLFAAALSLLAASALVSSVVSASAAPTPAPALVSGAPQSDFGARPLDDDDDGPACCKVCEQMVCKNIRTTVGTCKLLGKKVADSECE